MIEGLVDLHVHTKASDGLLTSREIIKEAKKIGLAAIGICDHDTAEGLKEALRAGKKFGIEVVPGIELSIRHQIKTKIFDLHFLGYYLDFENPILVKKLEYFSQKRKTRGMKMAEKLKELGFRLDFEKVKQKTTDGLIVKPHIVLAVFEEKENWRRLEKEFGPSLEIGPFIETYLNVGKPAYVPKAKLSAKEAIDLIHQCGGLAVLAHPGCDLDCSGKNDQEIRKFKSWGLDGIEAIAFVQDLNKTKRCIAHFSKLAQDLDLLMTGGSDFHGYPSRTSKEMECGLGFKNLSIKVEYSYLQRLKDKSKERKQLWRKKKK